MPNNISLISTNILTDSGVPLSAATSGTSGGPGSSGSSGTSGGTGLSGSSGTSGTAGVGYANITSTTSATPASTGTITLTTNSQGAFVTGDRVRAINTSSNLFEGIVTITGGTSFAIAADYNLGTTLATSWTITLTGVRGVSGTAGTAGTAGTSATSGNTGASGSSGTSGANGGAGPTGPTGPTGPSGTSNTYATAMNQYVNTNSNPSFGTIYASGEVYAYYSDDRLKDRIGEIKSATDKIMSLDAFYYIANELAKEFGYTDNKIEVGLSAQQIKAVMPETVSLAPFDRNQDTGESLSGENYITVNYAKLVTLLVAGFKEQQKEIEELKRK